MRRSCTGRGGFTLVEVLVSIAIFLAMSTMTVLMVNMVLNAWKNGERERVIYTRASTGLNQIVEDLTSTISREPLGVERVRVRFLCDLKDGKQRLMFVRSIEAGPERTHTYHSGMAGKSRELYDGTDDDNDKTIDNNLQALGGMMEVAYYVKGRTLMRGFRAPVQDSFLAGGLIGNRAQPLVKDVLYLGFRFWHQYTLSWDDPPRKKKSSRKSKKRKIPTWPVRVWDSTRGIKEIPFFMYRKPEETLYRESTLDYPADDVFPEMVEITLVVENDSKRTTKTWLRAKTTESSIHLRVESTRGFPDVPAAYKGKGGPHNYIKIGGEWMKYGEKTKRDFIIAKRGVRGTTRSSHARQSEVHVGRTFIIRTYIPAYKEDWSGSRKRK